MDAQGVALLTTLLTHGAGPFYVPIHRDALVVALETESQSLEVMDWTVSPIAEHRPIPTAI